MPETESPTFADTLRAWWRENAPEHLRDLDPTSLPPLGPPQTVESPEDAAARRARQAQNRNRAWVDRVPGRYRDARVDLLADGQNPDGRVSRWLGSERLGLLLAGPVGVGKTYAAYAVGWQAVDAGLFALAFTVADLNAELRPSARDAERTYERVVDADLLVLDDLGREQVTAWTLETLQRLIDARGRERRRTVYTTNLGYEEVRERYGSPLLDRIMDDAVVAKVTGPSRREPAPW